MKTQTVSIIGLGYIGLPTAVILASSGYRVVGMDLNQHVVEMINKGNIDTLEPKLGTLLRLVVTKGSLKAFNKVQSGDIYIICVPTPIHDSDTIPEPNIDQVLAATRSIAPLIKKDDLIILESTSPVGTTKLIQSILSEEGVDVDKINVAYCPERVLPGKIITEFLENDRIVGGITSTSTKKAEIFYKSFVRGKILKTDAKTAEMCKLAENSFRDVNIAFSNELSIICDKEGINVRELIELANHHPRVNILQPSTGVGGHCIAIDPLFIVSRDQTNTKLIQTAREVNNLKTNWVIDKIISEAKRVRDQKKKNIKIACLGLTYKPNVDDIRQSPSLEVVKGLTIQGYDVIVVEPNIKSHASINLTKLEVALDQASVIAILVKHDEFIKNDIRKKLITFKAIDFCGALHF